MKNRRSKSILQRAAIESIEQRIQLAAVTSAQPFNGQMDVATNTNIVVRFDRAMNPATLNSSTVILNDSSGHIIPASLDYDSDEKSIVINPTGNLQKSSNFYSVRIVGGINGAKGADTSPLSKDIVTSFSTGHVEVVDESVFGGVTDVTAIRFAPDGRVFVAEKHGMIKMFSDINDTTPQHVADISSQVYCIADSGLTGMALDPNFPASPYIYLVYTYDGDPGGPSPKYGNPAQQPYDTTPATLDPVFNDSGQPIGGGAPVSGRLTRITIMPSGYMVPGSEKVLISDWRQQWAVHSVDDVRFGPDGYLYISAGDGATPEFQDIGQAGNPFNDPLHEGGAVRAQDILTSGDPMSLNGTVIRVDPATGNAAPGNPYIDDPDPNKRRVIAWGLRNPFRMSFRPGTNELFIGDVGWNTYEEINVLSNATSGSTANFGWPAYEGFLPAQGWQSTASNNGITSLQGLYTNPAQVTMPLYAYHHNEKIVPDSDESTTGGSSPSGIAFYNGTAFPSVFDGAMFFVDYARRAMYVMYQGPNGKIDPSTRQLITNINSNSGYSGPVDLVVGPDGALYYSQIYSNQLLLHRIRAVGYDNLPVARFTFNGQPLGNAAKTVNFTSTSFDPSGLSLTYAWDLDGDGQFDDSTAPNPTYIFTTAGEYNVRLRVTNSSNVVSTSAPVLFSIYPGNNQPPTAQINSPTINSKFKIGDLIHFTGLASDPEDGSNVSIVWNIELRHSNDGSLNNYHTHVLATYTNVSSGDFVASNHEYPSWLAIRLTVTDSTGQKTVVEREIFPKTVQITFNSNIPGTMIAYGSQVRTTPFTTTVIAGSTATVSAITPQTINGQVYTFESWSDGQSRTHDLTVPGADSTYTITYDPATTTQLTGTIIGTPGGDLLHGPAQTMDNDPATYLNTPDPDGGWAGLDLGTPRIITQIGYLNAPGKPDLMLGGLFQGSSTADFTSNVVDLHLITILPTDGTTVTVPVNSGVPYRYVRYLAPNGAHGNVSEVKFYYAAISVSVPLKPTGLSGTTTITTAKLQWTDNSTNETGFRIERRLPGGLWMVAGSVGAGITTFTDTGLAASSSFEYRVVALSNDSDSDPSDSVTVTTKASAVPTMPQHLKAINSGTAVTLTWDSISAATTGINVQRRFVGWIWEDLVTLNPTILQYVDNTASLNVAYEYRLIAVGEIADSSPTDPISVSTAASHQVPVNPVATALTSTSVKLDWTSTDPLIGGFEIEMATGAGNFAPLTTAVGTLRTYTASNLIAGTAYRFRIRAIGPNLPSAYSAIVTATPAESITELSIKKSVRVTSTQSSSYPGSYAFDGLSTTRWSSSVADNQWIEVDLGKTYNITRVTLQWYTSYGVSYKIQVSNDRTTWTDAFSTTTGNGAKDDITGLTKKGRFVRMLGLKRSSTTGTFSLWSMSVYGFADPVVTPPPPPPTTTGTISGAVYWDSNKNGIREATDTGQVGKTVFIDKNNDGILNSGETSVVTDSTGFFKFTGLVAGSYKIKRVLPTGYKITTPSLNITLAAGQIFSTALIGTATV